jgi:hypothetical protein
MKKLATVVIWFAVLALVGLSALCEDLRKRFGKPRNTRERMNW